MSTLIVHMVLHKGSGLLSGLRAYRQRGSIKSISLKGLMSQLSMYISLSICIKHYLGTLMDSHSSSAQYRFYALKAPLVAGSTSACWTSSTRPGCRFPWTREDTLEAASYLQVTEALGLCGRYLERLLAPENCCFAANVAARFGLAHTLAAAERYIVRHLRQLLARGAGPVGLLELNPGSLRAVLGAPDLARVPEARLLGLALAWLRQEPAAERLAHCAALLERVRFGLVPVDVLRPVYSGSGLVLPARVKGLIIQALNYHTAPSRQPLLQGEQTSVRSPQTRILLVGGRRAREAVTEEVMVPQGAARGRGAAVEPEEEEEEEEQVEEAEAEDEEWELTQDVVAFDVYNHSWRSLTQLPAPLLGHSVCAVGNFLFVLGGESPSGGGASSPQADGPREVTALVHRYDPRFHAWTVVPAMREARAHFWCGAVGEGLLAVGGLGAGGEALASVEMYDLRRDRWTEAGALPRALHGHAGAVGDRGIVYISGARQGGARAARARPAVRGVSALRRGHRRERKRNTSGLAQPGHFCKTIYNSVTAFLGELSVMSAPEKIYPRKDRGKKLKSPIKDRVCHQLLLEDSDGLGISGLILKDKSMAPLRDKVTYDLLVNNWDKINCRMKQEPSPLYCLVVQEAADGYRSNSKIKYLMNFAIG
ncbi:hypothetical protein QTO34_000867 [Cnephaeus nilssonii]|uniref:BACK domain-containing protein n=1 Tax=Cnephaeus nilssonii TaxID=3371016 RepID=A0AA40ID66_CNENI|nr:hypothetical protein QTO34_000867 [Eptesicus nilssonii]